MLEFRDRGLRDAKACGEFGLRQRLCRAELVQPVLGEGQGAEERRCVGERQNR